MNSRRAAGCGEGHGPSIQYRGMMGTIDAIKVAAWEAHQAGLCVLPPREDGSKRPEGAEWSTFQSRLSTLDDLRGWYGNGRQGLGAVTGAISGNLEALEFDDLGTYEEFVAAGVAVGLGDLIARLTSAYEEETPGGGIHWLMRCAEIAGNTKLAQRPAGEDDQGRPLYQVLIETRGQGGYIVLAPSRGRVHPTGKAYRLRSGGFASIPEVTPEERRALWDLARTFDERPPREEETPRAAHSPSSDTGTRPGDDFKARATWEEVLEPHGWVRIFSRGGKSLWRRPGKDQGWSATTNYANSDLLYVFSSSTVFKAERGYNKFSAYAILNHGGDFGAAAGELARQGYGTPREARIAKLGKGRGEGDGGDTHDEMIDPNDYPLTDRGNAQLFAARCADELRYDHRRGIWLRWGGHWWRTDDNGHATRAAGRVSEWRLAALDTIEDERDRKAALRWAMTSQSRAKIDAILHLAQKVEPLAVAGNGWDTDLYQLGVANGVIDLRTGQLSTGDPADTVTLHSPITYDPDARAPRWLRFLEEVFLGESDLITFAQRFAGYSLTGDTREEKLLICYGEGANGKSTLLSALAHATGDYGYAMPFSTVEAQRNAGGPTNDLAALAGRRLIISSEVNESQPLNEARIKALTGGDPLTARFLNKEFFTFQPAAKFWLGVNHKPRVRDESKGFWRRIALLPFRASFEGKNDDKTLKATLRAEAAGILAWMVEGCLAWQREGLGLPEAVTGATEEYARESDPLGDFLADVCMVGAHHVARGSHLYTAYIKWANSQGIKDRHQMDNKRFGQLLSGRFERVRGGQGVTYKGVGVTLEWQEKIGV